MGESETANQGLGLKRSKYLIRDSDKLLKKIKEKEKEELNLSKLTKLTSSQMKAKLKSS